MRDQYIPSLNSAYHQFFGNHAGCPYFELCSRNMEPTKLQFDYAARIGINYGDVPKVLVIGLESKTQHHELTEPEYSLENADNDHYRKTLYMLSLILKGEEPQGFSKEALRPYEDVLKQFSLTNYYKCAFSADPDKCTGLKHSAPMKEHCHKLLLEEIDVLQPDLIVIQGKFTTKQFWTALDQRFGTGKREYGNKRIDDDTISLYQHERDGKPLFVLYSYHPSAIGHWMRTKEDLKAAINRFRKLYYQSY